MWVIFTQQTGNEVAGWQFVKILIAGQVGEWLKPTDCKSVPPCEVRRFESFPVHHKPPQAGAVYSVHLSTYTQGFSLSRLLSLVIKVPLTECAWAAINIRFLRQTIRQLRFCNR